MLLYKPPEFFQGGVLYNYKHMKINIKATNLDLTPAIHEYIEEKSVPLDRFLKDSKSKAKSRFY